MARRGNNQAEITFKANTSQFTQAIKEMNSTMSTLDKELALVNTQMKGSGESVELLQKKHDLLSQKLEASGTKVENLKSKLDEAKRVFGENSEEVQKCTNQLLTAENQYARLENQIGQVDDRMGQLNQQAREEVSALGQLENTISQQESALEQLKRQYQNVALEQGQSSQEAQDLAREIQDLSSELRENRSRLKEVADASDDLDNSMNDAEGGASGLKGVFEGLSSSIEPTIASSVALGEALVDLAQNAISLVMDAIKQFAEYLWELPEATEEVRNSLARVEASAKSNGKTVEGSLELYDELNKYYMDDNASSNCVSNILSIKASQEDLKETVEGMLGVWAEYGDGIDKESLAEDIALTVKMGEVQGALSEVIERTGGNVEEFQKGLAGCKTEEEKLAFVNDYLNGKLGETKKQFDETNASQIAYNDSQKQFEKSQARLAEAILPVKTAFNELKTQLLTALTPAIEWVCNKIGELADWFKGLDPNIQNVIKAIALATSVLLIIIGVIGAVAMALAPLILAVTVLDISLLPIIAVVLGIIAVITIVILVIQNWGTITDWLSEKWNQFTQWLSELPGKISEWFSQIISNVTTWASDMAGKAVEAGSGFVNNVINFVKSLPGKFWTWLTNTIGKVVAWISQMVSNAKKAGSNFVNNVVNGIKQLPGKIWTWLTNTIQKAVKFGSDMASKAKQAGSDFIKNMVSAIRNLPNKIGEIFSKAKQKVVDKLSEIKNKLLNFRPSWSIPKPKLPNISVEVAYKEIAGVNIPYPKFRLNALGGIMTQPTIFGMTGDTFQIGGEAGAEAILPLDGFYTHLDNKLESIVSATAIDYDMMTNSFITALENLTVSMSAKEVGRLTSKYTEQDINSRTKRLNRLGGATDIE